MSADPQHDRGEVSSAYPRDDRALITMSSRARSTRPTWPLLDALEGRPGRWRTGSRTGCGGSERGWSPRRGSTNAKPSVR